MPGAPSLQRTRRAMRTRRRQRSQTHAASAAEPATGRELHSGQQPEWLTPQNRLRAVGHRRAAAPGRQCCLPEDPPLYPSRLRPARGDARLYSARILRDVVVSMITHCRNRGQKQPPPLILATTQWGSSRADYGPRHSKVLLSVDDLMERDVSYLRRRLLTSETGRECVSAVRPLAHTMPRGAVWICDGSARCMSSRTMRTSAASSTGFSTTRTPRSLETSANVAAS